MGTMDWSALQSTVQGELDQGRLGRAVFLRCLAEVSESPQELRSSLDTVLKVADSWFGAQPEQVEVQGSEQERQFTAAARWPQGQTALVSIVSPSQRSAPRVDLILLCSRGAIHHQTPTFS